jgi:hypothetical protein
MQKGFDNLKKFVMLNFDQKQFDKVPFTNDVIRATFGVLRIGLFIENVCRVESCLL